MTVTVTIKQVGLDATLKGMRELVEAQQQLANQAAQGARAQRTQTTALNNTAQAAQNAAQESQQAAQATNAVTEQANRAAQALELQQQAAAANAIAVRAFAEASLVAQQALGLTERQIEQLSDDLNLLPDQILKAATVYTQLRANAADADTILQTLGTTFNLNAQQLEQLEEAIRFANTGLRGLTLAQDRAQGLARLGTAAQNTANNLNQLQQDLRQTGADLDNSLAAAIQAGNSVQFLSFALDQLDVSLGGILSNITGFIDAANVASAQGRGWIRVLNGLGKSVRDSNEVIAFGDRVARELGRDVGDVTDAYIDLLGAAQASGVETAILNDLFEESLRVFGLFNLEQNEVNRSFTAFTQILAKGTLSLEELRQQLGEAFPLALEVTAEGLGVTIQELNNLVTTGQVSGREFAIAFAEGLKEIEGSGAEFARTAANIGNRTGDLLGFVGDALFPLRRSFREATFTIVDDFVNIVTPALTTFTQVATATFEILGRIPAPIRELVTRFIALTSILATLAVSYATVVAASQTLIVQQTIAAVTANATTASLALQTVALKLNAVATFDLTRLWGLLVRGLTAGTGALVANRAALLATARTAATLVGQFLLVAAAVRAVQVAFDVFRDGGEGVREISTTITEGLVEIREEAGLTEKAIESTIPTEPPPANFVDGAIRQFNRLNGFLNNLVGLPDDFLAIPTASEELLNDFRIAIGDLSDDVGVLAEQGAQIAAGFEQGVEPSIQQLDAATKQQEVWADAIDEAQQQLESLDVQTLGTNAYEEFSQALRVTIADLTRSSDAFGEQTGVFREGSRIIEDLNKVLKELEDRFDNAVAAGERLALSVQADVAEAVANGSSTQAEAARELAQVEREEANSRLTAARNFQERLRQLQAERGNLPQIREQIIAADRAVNEARIDLAEATTAALEAEEEARLEAVERALAAQQQVVNEANNQRIRSRIELERELIQAGADEEEVSVRLNVIAAEDAAENIAQLIELQRQRVAAASDGTDERIAAEQELDDLLTQQAEAALDLTRARRDEIISTIEQSEERAIQSIDVTEARLTSVLERQRIAAEGTLSVFDAVTETLDRQGDLISAQNDLFEARNELVNTITGVELTNAERALEIRQRINSGDIQSSRERRALERELRDLGFGRRSSEERIEREILRVRQEQATAQLEQLTQAQQLERLSLDLEIERSRIATRRLEIETQIAIIQDQAASAALKAERARLVAQQDALQATLDVTTDPNARRELQQQIELNRIERESARAQQEANDQVLRARSQQLALVRQIARTEDDALQRQRETLELQQASATLQLTEQLASEARAEANQFAAQGERRLERRADRFADDLRDQADAARSRAEQLERRVAEPDLRTLTNEVNATTQKAQAELGVQTAASLTNATLQQQLQLQENLLFVEQQRVSAAQDLSETLRTLPANDPTAVNSAIPAFRTGGVTPGGVAAVGEGGPELGVFPRGTRILTHAESMRAAISAMRTNPTVARPFVSASSGVNTRRVSTAPSQSLAQSPTNARMEGLMGAQIGLMDRLNSTESRVYGEINRVRRNQDRNSSAISRVNRAAAGGNADQTMRLLLGGLI